MTKNDSKSFTQRVEEAFFGALDCNDPEQRELILNKLHSEDPGLCKEVRSMLADFPKAEVLFNDSSRNLVLPIELLADEELSEGALCNNYRIIQLLGEGGSSKVYKAEQIKPLRREVALKIVKLGMGFEGMRHKILYDVPAPPSSILQSPSGKSIAGKELDWIVMKAIEKDRERRYPTVHALADDLRRYLRNEPVEAHPPSRIYRLTKLIQRYRITALSIAAAFMALTGGLTFSSILYFRARRAELEQFKLRELAEESAHVSKAAILIMQGRMPDAEEEVRKMGGILSQPSLEATQVFSSLAMWNAKQGNWGTAADRWLAMSRVNQFDDSDMTDKVTENLLPIAPILLKTGDTIRYREFQEFLIDRIGMTNHPFATEHLLKLCLLTPADSSILNSLKHAAWVAEASLPADMATPPTDWMEAWRCVALAMWYFRNGQPDVAIPWCERSLLRDDWEKARGVQARLIRSMSLIKRGVSEPQYTAIQREKSEVIHYLQLPLDQMQGGYFHDWLIAEILLKEAEQLSHKESLQEDMQKDAH